jgi:hypothetical protein
MQGKPALHLPVDCMAKEIVFPHAGVLVFVSAPHHNGGPDLALKVDGPQAALD